MKYCMIIWSVLAAAVLCPSAVEAGDASPCNVGSDRQLFIDGAFFDKSKNVTLQLHQPKRTGEKNVQYDKPWESATLNWFSVLKDQGVIDKEAKYRMWYECYDVPGWPTNDDTSFCYAESRDGIHWTKPELGLFEYQGNKNNNILFRQIGEGDHFSRVHGTGVFLDPTAPPEARYKAVSQGQYQGATPPQRVSGMVSPDGLRWTRLPNRICDVFADSQYSAFWDPSLKKYVLYGRVGTGEGRSESADFAQFGPLQPVLLADSNDPPNSNLYNPAAVKYAGAANVYLMFPSLWQHAPDTLDIRMAVSRDGIRWTYPEQSKPFVPLGEADAFDSKTLYMGQGVIDAGDETWLYFSGSPQPHQKTELEDLLKCKQPRAMSRLVLRRDRFVSVEGGKGKEGGWFITPPLQFTGNTLKLNVDVRSGGSVRVALLDEKGKVLPGCGVKDCVPITGDHLDAVVQWKKGSDIGTFADQPVRMRIELRDASLFGFQFVTAPPSATPTVGKLRLWQLPAQSERNVMMSYVLQTAKGQLLVIDGGWEADAPYLREFLRHLGGRVHTWFITHQHDDHLGALTVLLRQPEGLQIDRIHASLLSEEWIGQHEPDQAPAIRAFNAAVAAYGKPVSAARVGEKLVVDSVTIETLAVSDATVKDLNNFINNQCMVLRLSTPATSVLFLADLGAAAGDRLLASNPGDERLRSEYVQMAHHGQNGVRRTFYEAIHARYALWPTPEWLYEAKKDSRFDTATVRQWMQELGIQKNYVMKDGLVELVLPVSR